MLGDVDEEEGGHWFFGWLGDLTSTLHTHHSVGKK